MQNSKIEWTDATWNPLRGCSKVSPGCKNCYAETLARRYAGAGLPYHGTINEATGRWNGEIRLVPEKLLEPYRWQRPRMIFCNSMSDLFHDNVPFEYIDKVMAVVSIADRHVYQILTKRPERMREYFAQTNLWERIEAAAFDLQINHSIKSDGFNGFHNLWLGVSVESQEYVYRIELLNAIKWATVKWVSAEPLLGPLRLSAYLPFLDWVVVGGESGHGARPMNPDWVWKIAEDCSIAESTPFFFKQWGEWHPYIQDKMEDMFGPDYSLKQHFVFEGQTDHTDRHMYRVGKKFSGRLLRGSEWNEYPRGVYLPSSTGVASIQEL